MIFSNEIERGKNLQRTFFKENLAAKDLDDNRIIYDVRTGHTFAIGVKDIKDAQNKKIHLR